MDLDVSRRTLLRTVVAGTALTAGCASGSSTPTETDEPTATEMPTESPTATEGDPGPTVQVRSHPDLGEILVGPQGMTLYMFDQDTKGAGESTCSGSCASTWPPLTLGGDPSSGDAVTAELTTFEREGGSTQVSANGWPLYYFTPDEEPGDVTGQGVNDVWWVLRPDGTPVRSNGSPTATETPTGTATSTSAETPTPTDSSY